MYESANAGVRILVILLLLSFPFTMTPALAQNVVQEGEPDRPIYAPVIPVGLHSSEPGESWQSASPQVQPYLPHEWGYFRMAFQSYRDSNWEIYIATGEPNQARLTNNKRPDIQPRLNLGCTRIVYVSQPGKELHIFVMNTDGSGQADLTPKVKDNYNPFWSPDGSRIVFQSTRDGQSEIYVMNADGTNPTRLTWDVDYDGMPSWSPDGSKIVFISHRTGGYRVWVMNADGSGQAQLSQQPYSAHPFFSPDGTRIAYDVDSDGNGFAEIWVMNADGTGQQFGYRPAYPNSDAWVSGWSPTFNAVTFTYINWILYRGQWYWTNAYLKLWWVGSSDNVESLGPGNLEWSPHVQISDLVPPSSRMEALPYQTTAPFTIHWTGQDTGGAGIMNYDVQVKDGAAGTWKDLLTQYSGEYWDFPGVGGHTYYFRVRARDYALQLEEWPQGYDAVTWVESAAPRTSVAPLPAFTRGAIALSWEGTDPGGSGIKDYDVQYRDGPGGSWVNFMTGTRVISTTLDGHPGHTYYFRVRATDNAQNVEPWPSGEGDTSTTLYDWMASGTVHDNAGTPVSKAQVGITAAVPGSFISDSQGHVDLYTTEALSHTMNVSKSGYGELPGMLIEGKLDGTFDTALPPIENLVQDWGFESGGLSAGWISNGDTLPSITGTLPHSGNFAALLGRVNSFGRPEQLTSDNTTWSGSPQLAIGENGEVHLVWVEDSKGIYYRKRGLDGAWSSVTVISNPVQGWTKLVFPQLVMDGDDRLHLTWLQDDKAYYSSRDPAGVWDSPLLLSGAGIITSAPYMALDGVGRVHIVWVKSSDGTQLSLAYTRRNPDGTWIHAPDFFLSNHDVLSPQFAVDAQGNAHWVWVDSDFPRGDIYATYRPINGTWTIPVNLSNTPDDSSQDISPLAIDSQGNLHVVWYESGGQYSYYYRSRSKNGTWSSKQGFFATSNPNAQSNLPQIRAGEDGSVHLVYSKEGQFYHSALVAPGVWSDPIQISQGEGERFNGDVRIDTAGDLHITWILQCYSCYEPYQIQYVRRNAGADWSSILNVAVGRVYLTYDMMAFDRSGGVHITWQTNTMEDNEIFYSKMAVAGQGGESRLSQGIVIPSEMISPVLSFYAKIQGASDLNGTWFGVWVNEGGTDTRVLLSMENSPGWRHYSLDMSAWAGKAVTLTLTTHQEMDMPYISAFLDEVSLGPAYPDLWVTVKSSLPAALPGDQVTFTVTYGNHSAITAHNVVLTDLLPKGLAFVSSSLPPNSTGVEPSWHVGDMPGKSGPFTFTIVVDVTPSASLGSGLTNQIRITCDRAEPEAENNLAETQVFVGNIVYLPGIIKE